MKAVSFFLLTLYCRKNISGPITTVETEPILNSWAKKTQDQGQNSPKFEENRAKLNLQENEEHTLECRGRIQGDFPVDLPNANIFIVYN